MGVREATRTAVRRRWTTLAVLSLAQFMVILDVTVVNVALPSIGADLALDRGSLTWVMTAYVLTFGGLMLLGGRLADVIGRRRSFLAGLTIFTAASLVSALAPNGAVLISARAAQGAGAALLSPAALSIITTTFQGHERHRALGVWAAIGGAGAAAGVLVGGVLASGPGWPWVFYLNVPVGIAVGAAVPALVVAGRPLHTMRRVDLPGAVLVTAAMALLVFGLVQAGDAGWTSTATLGTVAAAAVALVAFVAVERSVREPLVDLAVVVRRSVASGAAVMLAASGLLIAAFFLSSQYLQRSLELSAISTGLVFLPVAVTIGVGAHLAARQVGRFGTRPVAVTGFALGAAGAGLMARVPDGASVLTDLLPGFLLLAAGLGVAFVAATTTAMTRVGHEEAGLVSGLVNTGHELGAGLGVAVMSTVAAASLAGAPGSAAPVGGFQAAFATMAIVAAAAAGGSLLALPAGRAPVSEQPVFAH